ncbi:hypothetical protein B0T18DRAFT_467024 [Schizothecium vesticola]|uniref:Uncharacterized protein n=1 Tax=Schizothecium vesticola TaxID=314040 RepID=A0AA40K1I5_9PEZI|nr:hypothetical protein B0T18DRAFT_467024 [Schizothecium vesticola]
MPIANNSSRYRPELPAEVKVLQPPAPTLPPSPVPSILWLPGTCKWQGPSGHWKQSFRCPTPRLDPTELDTILPLCLLLSFHGCAPGSRGSMYKAKTNVHLRSAYISASRLPVQDLARWPDGRSLPVHRLEGEATTHIPDQRRRHVPQADISDTTHLSLRFFSARVSDRSEEASPVTATTTTECKDQEQKPHLLTNAPTGSVVSIDNGDDNAVAVFPVPARDRRKQTETEAAAHGGGADIQSDVPAGRPRATTAMVQVASMAPMSNRVAIKDAGHGQTRLVRPQTVPHLALTMISGIQCLGTSRPPAADSGPQKQKREPTANRQIEVIGPAANVGVLYRQHPICLVGGRASLIVVAQRRLSDCQHKIRGQASSTDDAVPGRVYRAERGTGPGRGSSFTGCGYSVRGKVGVGSAGAPSRSVMCGGAGEARHTLGGDHGPVAVADATSPGHRRAEGRRRLDVQSLGDWGCTGISERRRTPSARISNRGCAGGSPEFSALTVLLTTDGSMQTMGFSHGFLCFVGMQSIVLEDEIRTWGPLRFEILGGYSPAFGVRA